MFRKRYRLLNLEIEELYVMLGGCNYRNNCLMCDEIIRVGNGTCCEIKFVLFDLILHFL